MNLTELARLAAEAQAIQDQDWHKPLWKDHYAYVNSCTPERIAALVRVAEAAGSCFSIRADRTVVFINRTEYLNLLRGALRDLEATP